MKNTSGKCITRKRHYQRWDEPRWGSIIGQRMATREAGDLLLRLGPLLNHLVQNPKFLGLIGAHEVVAIHSFLNQRKRLRAEDGDQGREKGAKGVRGWKRIEGRTD